MITIQFKDLSLCKAFYNQLLDSMDTYVGVKDAIMMEQFGDYTNLCIDFSAINGDEVGIREKVASIFTNMTMKEILPIWFEEWLRESYYYKDPDEIKLIIEHARELMYHSNSEVSLKDLFLKLQREMFYLYDQFIHHSVHFSFDSFLRFRLRKIKNKVVEIVEKAIDEHKLEHDYQIMVNTCRQFLQSNPPRVKVVYLFMENEMIITDSNGESITAEQISSWLTHELCFEEPLPLSERVVGPLVSIAPDKLIIYPKQHHEGLLQTLLTIFEERIELREEVVNDISDPL
ncbi:putative sporulation protein YtxC [Evansella sp. AB-P1]|uniref:putative sporulation protein YtxC n=1 Tax=Evansella sp. AB-P1 TaxID=3037653 RepID=UPI00241FF8D7|nr:putative sporulation protein YtxC [Evansella sp. AB-P1]MDG5786957.1 putative sporulation protein YtxC [Evansella sp. AB-P1]